MIHIVFPIVLELPEPPRQGGGTSMHWRGKWAKLNAYKADVWAAAIQQVKPMKDPPRIAIIHLHYRLWSRREPVNLYVDCKSLIDALKQRHPPRDRLTWKQGLFLDLGYYVDDDQLQFGNVTQEIDRKRRGVTLTIERLIGG